MTTCSDSFGRKFSYLRLSITDLCNFSCTYCLPSGYQATPKTFLNVDEIRRLVRAFAQLGMQKIRLTGGEPTIRKDFLEIVAAVAATPGVKKVALTTNGYRLEQQVDAFYHAGITALNVSVDTLDPIQFQQITGHNRLPSILAGVLRAEQLGFSSVKLNAVLLKDINDNQLPHFLTWIKDKKISMRFIELMQTGTNLHYFKKHHLSATVIQEQLIAQDWKAIPRQVDAGPAIEYEHPDYAGKIGLIAPYSKDFCATCNRLRVSARGDLHLCLFTDIGYGLRSLLQSDEQLELLKAKVVECLQYKKISHFLQEEKTGLNNNFSAIGG